MKLSKKALAALILAVLTSSLAYAGWRYYVEISYVARQYVVPSSVNLDLGEIYVGNSSGHKDFGAIATVATWGKWMNLTVTQTKDLTQVFSHFNVSIQIDVAENGWAYTSNVDIWLGEPWTGDDLKVAGSSMWATLPSFDGQSYRVLLKVLWEAEGIDLGVHEVNGTAHLEFTFEPVV